MLVEWQIVSGEPYRVGGSLSPVTCLLFLYREWMLKGNFVSCIRALWLVVIRPDEMNAMIFVMLNSVYSLDFKIILYLDLMLFHSLFRKIFTVSVFCLWNKFVCRIILFVPHFGKRPSLLRPILFTYHFLLFSFPSFKFAVHTRKQSYFICNIQTHNRYAIFNQRLAVLFFPSTNDCYCLYH